MSMKSDSSLLWYIIQTKNVHLHLPSEELILRAPVNALWLEQAWRKWQNQTMLNKSNHESFRVIITEKESLDKTFCIQQFEV